MSITKSEFVDWKASPVTKAVFEGIAALIEEGKNELAESAGYDSLSDREKVGKIRGLRSLLDIEFSDVGVDHNA